MVMYFVSASSVKMEIHMSAHTRLRTLNLAYRCAEFTNENNIVGDSYTNRGNTYSEIDAGDSIHDNEDVSVSQLLEAEVETG